MTWIAAGNAATQIRQTTQTIAAIQYLDPEGQIPWLWRGQADSGHALSPAIHTAIIRNSHPLCDEVVLWSTERLITRARSLRLDRHEGTRLPDMALLARLQHYGVATPLLDVTVDPVVALYMTAVNADRSTAERPGRVFGLPHAVNVPYLHAGEDRAQRTIAESHGQLDPYDDRSFADVYVRAIAYAESPDASCGGCDPREGVPLLFYAAPHVTERLGIQRGYFLLGSVSEHLQEVPEKVKEPHSTLRGVRFDDGWIGAFVQAVGKVGRPSKTARPRDLGAVVCIDVRGMSTKHRLREWIEPRSGLIPEVVYPPAWHEPHLEAWARRNGRFGMQIP